MVITFETLQSGTIKLWNQVLLYLKYKGVLPYQSTYTAVIPYQSTYCKSIRICTVQWEVWTFLHFFVWWVYIRFFRQSKEFFEKAKTSQQRWDEKSTKVSLHQSIVTRNVTSKVFLFLVTMIKANTLSFKAQKNQF